MTVLSLSKKNGLDAFSKLREIVSNSYRTARAWNASEDAMHVDALGKGGKGGKGDHHKEIPFMALVTQGIPSQARLSEEQVRKLEGEPGPPDLMLVEVEGENAWIPNLEYLESLVLKSRH